eukprot:2497002-Rhodomonas_salina.4
MTTLRSDLRGSAHQTARIRTQRQAPREQQAPQLQALLCASDGHRTLRARTGWGAQVAQGYVQLEHYRPATQARPRHARPASSVTPASKAEHHDAQGQAG